jgi:hypothetical protein
LSAGAFTSTPELLANVRLHVGGFVVQYAQAGVTVNLRRLNAAGP